MIDDPLLNRVPPHNLDAEESVLSALFINNAGFNDINGLSPEKFYKKANGKIFNAMLALRIKNEPVDLVSVAQELKSRNELESIGGASYLAHIADTAPVALNIGHYAKVVCDAFTIRTIIITASKIVEQGFNEKDIEEYISKAQSEILKIQSTSSQDKIFTMDDLMNIALDRIEMAQTSDTIIGFNMGFPKLDTILQNVGSKLIVLAGRPGMGKTGMGLSIAKKIAKDGVKVGFLSIEMDKEALADRWLGDEGDLNPLRFYVKGELNADSINSLNSSASQLSSLPIYIDDSECMIQDVERKCRKLKKMGCDVIFIDQLSKIRGRSNQSKYETYTDHCSAIALLKKELRMPIFLLCQVNRDVEQRSDKRPTLADLKQTGMLEEDADIVLFLYRPGYYDENIDQSKTEILLAKNRHGATSIEYQVLFNKRRGMFNLE